MSKPRNLPHGCIVPVPFLPYPGLGGAHAQTMMPALLRRTPALVSRHERLELPDGDFVDLAHSGSGNGPIAVLVHGLGGGFDSKYLRGTALHLIAQGWRTLTLQLRGGGATANRLARTYHHGDTADLRYLWHWLRAKEPLTRIASVGWSLGGNVVLKAAGEEGDAAPVDFVAAASVPFKLEECVEFLKTGFARVYQNRMLDDLKQMIRRKVAGGSVGNVDVQAALRARDFTEFDNAWTAPLNGFADAADYYARAACGQYLHAIRRPTLIVHALDDPFMVPSIIPPATALAPSVLLELCERGGHVGFVGQGRRGRPEYWLEQRLSGWLQGSLERSP